MTSEDEALRRLLDQLTSIAAHEADRAISAAISDARARAVPLVRRMLIDSLVERLGESSPSGDLRAPPRSVRSDIDGVRRAIEGVRQPLTGGAARSEEGPVLTYMYGVSSARLPIPSGLRGVAGAPVHSITVGSLTALVSPVAAADFAPDHFEERLLDPDWLEQNARAHEAVLKAAAASGTILPLRFGGVHSSEQSLQEVLLGAEPALRESLEAFEGASEWAVRATARGLNDPTGAEDAALASQTAAEDSDAGSRYMRARRETERLRAERDAASDRCSQVCHSHFVELSLGSVVAPLPPRPPRGHGEPAEETLLKAAYLVGNTRVPELRSAALELEGKFESLGLRVQIDGPLPPYHFVPADLLGTPVDG